MQPAPIRFETDQFTLRAYTPEDAEALADATTSSYEHLRPWLPWASPNQTVEESLALCRKFAESYEVGNDFVIGIWKGSVLLGGTGFHPRLGNPDWKNCEIGMWIRSSVAGMGLGTRVLHTMLHWGFTEWEWRRLVWRCDTRNLASERVAQKCGLRLEGTHRGEILEADGSERDIHWYAMRRSEFAV